MVFKTDTKHTNDFMKNISFNRSHQKILVCLVNIADSILNILNFTDAHKFLSVCVMGLVELMETCLLPSSLHHIFQYIKLVIVRLFVPYQMTRFFE